MITKWKSGEIIRKKETGKPYLVLHTYKNICTIVADLDASSPSVPMVILEKDYYIFASDREMKQIIEEEYNGIQEKWEHDPDLNNYADL